MAEKVQAIVIRANDRKEKDKNVLLFSLEKGKVWATLKGVKSPSAKMKIAQNPFCYGEFVLEDGKAGQIVTGFEAIETFHEISEDVDRYFEGTAILEIVNAIEFSSQNEVAKVFVLTLKALKTLCFSKVSSLYVLDKFLIELFAIAGTPLETKRCSSCDTTVFDRMFLDYATGELVCINCKGYASEELEKTTFLALKYLSENDFDRLSTFKFAQGSELGLLRVLVRNFETRFDRKLKLLGILS